MTRAALGLAVAAALLAASGAAAAEPAAPRAVVAGKVTREGEGTAGARVLAFPGFDAFVARRPSVVSEPTAEDGAYRLELPAGTWYLAARKADGALEAPLPPGGLFAFPGSNPFTLAAGDQVEASFSLALLAAGPRVAPGADPGSGTLAGVVTHQGRPLPGATVKLYLDAESDFRGMGYATSPPTDENGAFRFEYLPDSDFFVLARKRAAGPAEGPIGEGDFYAWYGGNPVGVRAGSEVSVGLEAVSKGRAAGNADTRPRPTGTRVAGRILDAAGAPVPGVHAYAYEEKVMSHKKPAFLSSETGADGRYVLHLGRGGTFYVGARSGYGDSPAKGEWYGLYGGAVDHGVTLAEGEAREGVDVVVERILPGP